MNCLLLGLSRPPAFGGGCGRVVSSSSSSCQSQTWCLPESCVFVVAHMTLLGVAARLQDRDSVLIMLPPKLYCCPHLSLSVSCCVLLCRHWTVQHFSLVAAQAEHGSVQVPASKWLKNKTQHQQRKQRHQQHQWERKHQQQQHQQQQQPNQQQQQYSGSVHVHQLSAEERPVVGIHHYSASWTGWDQSHRLVKLQQLKAEVGGCHGEVPCALAVVAQRA